MLRSRAGETKLNVNFTEDVMSTEEIVEWVRRFRPYYDEDECLEAYELYCDYRDEGQTFAVSLQYAGLL